MPAPFYRPKVATIRGLLAVLVFAYTLTGAMVVRAEEWSRVRRVIDGDTLETEERQRVRLVGVDAPEYRPWEGIAEPYGKEAGLFLRRHLTGRPVRLVRDRSDRDRYGRLLRYVFTEDGEMVNARLVREGLAEVKAYPPDTTRQSELMQAQSEARSSRRGLWADTKTRKHRR